MSQALFTPFSLLQDATVRLTISGIKTQYNGWHAGLPSGKLGEILEDPNSKDYSGRFEVVGVSRDKVVAIVNYLEKSGPNMLNGLVIVFE